MRVQGVQGLGFSVISCLGGAFLAQESFCQAARAFCGMNWLEGFLVGSTDRDASKRSLRGEKVVPVKHCRKSACETVPSGVLLRLNSTLIYPSRPAGGSGILGQIPLELGLA